MVPTTTKLKALHPIKPSVLFLLWIPLYIGRVYSLLPLELPQGTLELAFNRDSPLCSYAGTNPGLQPGMETLEHDDQGPQVTKYIFTKLQ